MNINLYWDNSAMRLIKCVSEPLLLLCASDVSYRRWLILLGVKRVFEVDFQSDHLALRERILIHWLFQKLPGTSKQFRPIKICIKSGQWEGRFYWRVSSWRQKCFLGLEEGLRMSAREAPFMASRYTAAWEESFSRLVRLLPLKSERTSGDIESTSVLLKHKQFYSFSVSSSFEILTEIFQNAVLQEL